MEQVKNTSGFSVSAIAIRQHIGTLMLTLADCVGSVFYHNCDLLPITYP